MKIETITQLILAIIQIESGGNDKLINKREVAYGPMQIRRIYVKDVNRILLENKDSRYFLHQDAFDRDKSIDMFMIYVFYWGDVMECETGRPATLEDYARIHNGGPRGWQKESTKAYWEKVKQAHANTSL